MFSVISEKRSFTHSYTESCKVHIRKERSGVLLRYIDPVRGKVSKKTEKSITARGYWMAFRCAMAPLLSAKAYWRREQLFNVKIYLH
jgi:hypothetical protein